MPEIFRSGALVLTLTGAWVFWGAQVLEVEGFYAASAVIFGLALILLGGSALMPLFLL